MAKKKYERFYKYKCTISDMEYTVTAEAPHPDELTSVAAFYEMNPEEDDRPEHIRKVVKQELDQKLAQADDESELAQVEEQK